MLMPPWPGNVRALRNRIERAVALADGPGLGPASLFPERAPSGAAAGPLSRLADARSNEAPINADALLRQTDDNRAKGFRAIKMKVDRANLSEDVERVKAMREHPSW